MKAAVLTPHHGDVRAAFAFSLASMVGHTARARPDIELRPFFLSSSLLAKARTMLVEQALAWGADWLLWADADQLFPPDSLIRLLAHGLDAVGANYPRRQAPGGPTAGRVDEAGRWHPVFTTADKAAAGLVEEVDVLGTGLVLVSAAAVRRVEPPLFAVEPPRGGSGWTSEDVWFFARLRDSGVRLHVDHGLSWEVGHVAERILTNADAGARDGA